MIVEKKFKELSKPFITEGGYVLKEPIVSYEEYGLEEGPVIFIAHGGLSDQHAAGKYSGEESLPGWWDGLIGEGKAIDTNKYRVISASSLGSACACLGIEGGTTSPLTLNPDTNKNYGPDFPEITLIDMVKFHKAFLEEIGVEKLFMMAGPSMGSLQSLQMAALYPDFVGAVTAVATSGRMTPGGMAMHNFITETAKSDPEFNDGWYEIGKPKWALRIIQQISKIYYTSHEGIKEVCWDTVPEGQDSQKLRNANCKNYVTGNIDAQIYGRDLNCYIRAIDAINTYDLGRDAESYEKGVKRIKCPVLLMNIDTDSEFPPEYAFEIADILNSKNPNKARVKVIKSNWGHLGCLREVATLDKEIREFIKEIN